MRVRPIAFVTPPDAARWQRWLIFSPLARLVIFTATFILLSKLITVPAQIGIGHSLAGAAMAKAWIYLLTFVLPALLAYLFLVHVIERRPATELAWRKLLPYGVAGLLGGAMLFSAVVGMLWALGSYHVSGINPQAHWLPALLIVGLGAGIGEEILFRGILFRIMEEGLGTWAALLVSALFFGAVHLGNPGATLWSSAAIAIEAGLLFGLLYHLTRSLYPCMGVHAAWNFTQGTVYGIPVSGLPADGWLVSSRSGPDWLSGGVFGAEASVVALVICSMLTLAMLRLVLRDGTLIPLRWRRRNPMLD